MVTFLVVLSAVLSILHLPAVVKFVKKTKTKWDDRGVQALEKVKDLLDDKK